MPVKFTSRPASARGSANHGWLHTFRTFSFANYYDPRFDNFGPLRVLNEEISRHLACC
ncbi:hypothetical protein BJ742DRAFT_822181 [Cladochytrium replicatum]|nr:hypothetical protein BJ742DRAFT_822181 [Cladochytrium replicatum]